MLKPVSWKCFEYELILMWRWIGFLDNQLLIKLERLAQVDILSFKFGNLERYKDLNLT